MDKESIYELQKLDCNCNDCGYMERRFDLFQQSLVDHERWQLDYFNSITNNMIENAIFWRDKRDDIAKHDSIMKEVKKRKFQFDKSGNTINFGNCNKLNKLVTFIPNTLQLDTQDCFEHRKDLLK